MDDGRVAQLRRIADLSPLGEDALVRLAARLRQAELGAGDGLVNAESIGFTAILIEDGYAEITRETKRLGRLGPGDVVGGRSSTSASQPPASITAVTRMTLWLLDPAP